MIPIYEASVETRSRSRWAREHPGILFPAQRGRSGELAGSISRSEMLLVEHMGRDRTVCGGHYGESAAGRQLGSRGKRVDDNVDDFFRGNCRYMYKRDI